MTIAFPYGSSVDNSAQLGSLSLALRSITDANSTENDGDDDGTKRSSVNVIRFGVGTTTTPK